jgi:integrase
MELSIKLTKRVRKRKLSSGVGVRQERYVLNFRDPRSGQRRQLFFERKKEAEAKQRSLLLQAAEKRYVNERTVATVSEAIEAWIADRTGKVKAPTLKAYKVVVKVIRGPLLEGTAQQRAEFTATGKKPKGARFIRMLGDVKLNELTTGDIRVWHRTVVEQCGAYTANRAKSHLKSILALAEEDSGVRAPSMPTGLSRARGKAKKVILSPLEAGKLIEAARNDPEHGVYYAVPFLAGTRPSEQLGLLWRDVDFERNVMRIRRIQERDGSLTEMTKTEAGTRDIPMGSVLREMLLAWRVRCPRLNGELHRVFPGPGRLEAWPKARTGGGGPLLYQNFRRRYWEPAFKHLELPYVTPHSARHSFISTMQAQGVEVGLVAKLAGHANAVVTLGHYTQAVRGGQAAVEALERAYAAA